MLRSVEIRSGTASNDFWKRNKTALSETFQRDRMKNVTVIENPKRENEDVAEYIYSSGH